MVLALPMCLPHLCTGWGNFVNTAVLALLLLCLGQTRLDSGLWSATAQTERLETVSLLSLFHEMAILKLFSPVGPDAAGLWTLGRSATAQMERLEMVSCLA